MYTEETTKFSRSISLISLAYIINKIPNKHPDIAEATHNIVIFEWYFFCSIDKGDFSILFDPSRTVFDFFAVFFVVLFMANYAKLNTYAQRSSP